MPVTNVVVSHRKCVWCSTKTTFNVYVSQQSQIQFEDEDLAVYMSFHWVTTTLSSLRTTTCDALVAPSGDPRPEIEFDFEEKHIHKCTLKVVFVEHHTHFLWETNTVVAGKTS